MDMAATIHVYCFQKYKRTVNTLEFISLSSISLIPFICGLIILIGNKIVLAKPTSFFLFLLSIWQMDISFLYAENLFQIATIEFLFRLCRFGPIMVMPLVYYIAFYIYKNGIDNKKIKAHYTLIFNKFIFFFFLLFSFIVYFLNFTSYGVTGLKRVHQYATFPPHLIPMYGTWNLTFYIDNILVFVHSFLLLFICQKISDGKVRGFYRSVVFASFFIYINGVLSGFLYIPLFLSTLNTVFAAIILFAAYFMLQNYTIEKINQELKDGRKLLVRTENLRVLGEMAAGIAHEIRNPLTSIKGFVKLIDNGISDSDQKYYLSIVSEEIDRIDDVVGELLFIAKPQASVQERRKVNINKVVQDVEILLGASALLYHKSIDIRMNGHMETVMIEEKQIKQVLINILKNALEAVATESKIKIKAEKLPGNKIRIRVIDNGCGITKAKLQKLGEPFYTTKERGTGLGLTVCFKIIRDSNGQIIFRSKENVGTIVDIILPE